MTQAELEHAQELLRKRRYAEAIEKLRLLLSLDPDNVELRGRVADAYQRAGNSDRAFHHFHKAALLSIRHQNLKGAAQMLRSADAVSPNEPDVLYRLAESLQHLGELQELEQILQRLIQAASATGDRRRLWALEQLAVLHPQNVDLAIRRAVALGEVGRVHEALKVWKLLSNKLDPRVHEVVSPLKALAEAAEEMPSVGVELAAILLSIQRPRDALALLVPYYEKFPEEVMVLESLVRALEYLGVHDKLVAARIELLKARVKHGHRDFAVKDIAKLLEFAGNEPTVLEVCAHSYTTFGFIGEASKLWLQLAMVFESQGNKPQQNRAILMLLQRSPNHEEGLMMGARNLRDAGKLREAIALEQRLREVRQNRAQEPAETAPLSAPPSELGHGPRESSSAPVMPQEMRSSEDVTRAQAPTPPIHRSPYATQPASQSSQPGLAFSPAQSGTDAPSQPETTQVPVAPSASSPNLSSPAQETKTTPNPFEYSTKRATRERLPSAAFLPVAPPRGVTPTDPGRAQPDPPEDQFSEKTPHEEPVLPQQTDQIPAYREPGEIPQEPPEPRAPSHTMMLEDADVLKVQEAAAAPFAEQPFPPMYAPDQPQATEEVTRIAMNSEAESPSLGFMEDGDSISDVWASEEELPGNAQPDANKTPLEAPEYPEETTNRMNQLISEELTSEFEDEPPTRLAHLGEGPAIPPSKSSPEQRAARRSSLIADLLEETKIKR